MESIKNVFNQDFMNKLDNMKFNINRDYTGSFSGDRRSKARGSSMEFSDYREYNIGDDLRRIDWNTYGRLNKYYVKIYEEERQTNINIFLDISKSMDFGDINKFFYAKILAASLAYIGLTSSDSVNVYTFNDIINPDIINVSNKSSILNVVDFLDKLETAGETNYEKAFENIGKYKIRTGKTIILSDFLSDTNYEKALLNLIYRRQELIVFHILSEEEINPNLSGGTKFVDNEDGSKLDIEVNDYILNEYKNLFENHQLKLEKYCKMKDINYIYTLTNESYFNYINSIMRK